MSLVFGTLCDCGFCGQLQASSDFYPPNPSCCSCGSPQCHLLLKYEALPRHPCASSPRFAERGAKEAIAWPGMLHALSALINARNIHTEAILTCNELHTCLASLTRLPRAVVIDSVFQVQPGPLTIPVCQ